MITVTTLGLMTPYQKQLASIDELSAWLQHVGYLRRDGKRELDVNVKFDDDGETAYFLISQTIAPHNKRWSYVRSHRIEWTRNSQFRQIANLWELS